jgi:hypothetical protein
MRAHHLYYEFDAEDRKVYTATGLRRTLAPWALIAVLVAAICTVLALDGSTTAEQRIAPYLQSGVFP